LPRILIADDQPDVLHALGFLLKGAGSQTVSAMSPAAVLDAVRAQSFDAVLMDLNYTRDTTSGEEGLDLVSKVKGLAPNLPIIVMTAWGTIELAVEAMRRGARDFVLKPWDNAQLLHTLQAKIEEGDRQTRLQAEQNARQERLAQDMAIARQVQINLFPRTMNRFDGIEYAGRCIQAGEVGGDYYDFPDVGANRFAAVLADVSGKGIPAALLMANLQATLRSQCLMGVGHLPGLMRGVNRLFQESTEPHHFATLFFSSFDPVKRVLRYVNCGHNPPLLVRASGAVERLHATAPVIGLLPFWDCVDDQTTLNPGDLLVIYSDGVTEAGRDSGDEFGEDRLLEAVRRAASQPLDAMLDSINCAVRDWLHGKHQEDDLTVVLLRGI
jgi:sigma-B regulation protein RsbU (phosphoserine phosphatase)